MSVSEPIPYPEALDIVLAGHSIKSLQIETAPPTEEFLSKARQIARRAEGIRLVRGAVEGMNYSPLPLPDLLSVAARKAQVDLARILDPATKGGHQASSWIIAAKNLGMSCEKITRHFRLWFAERVSDSGDQPVYARDGARKPATPSSPTCLGEDPLHTDALLASIESDYDENAKSELSLYLAAIHDEG